ncbi:hypothetical protein LK533_14215 [Sphingomonas sp. PL-96]|uniref:hypothetical protein n=1 Tax=Sphingomonas sp. PL-96 TaxID=2887201 RepID=UPI001E633A1C|nr:hypothetical protein [Sphingomonas sp. PL-96]MCC2977826.1 hypothetical protein [Sphingomonas sp. PL-96]
MLDSRTIRRTPHQNREEDWLGFLGLRQNIAFGAALVLTVVIGRVSAKLTLGR